MSTRIIIVVFVVLAMTAFTEYGMIQNLKKTVSSNQDIYKLKILEVVSNEKDKCGKTDISGVNDNDVVDELYGNEWIVE